METTSKISAVIITFNEEKNIERCLLSLKEVADEIIVIPDQDEAGLEMIDSAIEHGFSVAFPTWEDHIKDVNDAVLRYGHLFVTVDAIKTSHQSKIKISMHKKKLEQRLKKHEEVN